MDNEKIDIERVRTLYNQMDYIWPASDKWYTYVGTHRYQQLKVVDEEHIPRYQAGIPARVP